MPLKTDLKLRSPQQLSIDPLITRESRYEAIELIKEAISPTHWKGMSWVLVKLWQSIESDLCLFIGAIPVSLILPPSMMSRVAFSRNSNNHPASILSHSLSKYFPTPFQECCQRYSYSSVTLLPLSCSLLSISYFLSRCFGRQEMKIGKAFRVVFLLPLGSVSHTRLTP